MKKKIKLTLLILVIAVCNSFGQNDFRSGFIITPTKDTIQGQVNFRSNLKNYESCIFKDEQAERVFFPDQILGYGIVNDKFFSSQIVEGSFVEVLVIGQLSLYKSREKYHLKKDTTVYDLESVMEKVEIDGKVGELKSVKWLGILSYLISDCLANNHISTIQLEEKSLTRLIVKYNECSGKEFIEYKVSKPWTKIEYGLAAGFSMSGIQITDYSGMFPYLDDSYNSLDPSAGVVISISSPRLSEKFAFQGEIHFIKSSFSSLVKLEGFSTDYHDTYINLNTLSVPFSAKYSFPAKRYGWYLQGGINYCYHLSSNTTHLSERVTRNIINTFPESSLFEVSNSQYGVWGGIGILKSYRTFKGSIAIRYSRMSNLNKTVGFAANNNLISLNVILFKK